MRLSTVLISTFCTIAVIAILLLVLGVNFHAPVPAKGASLYDPASEQTITGAVSEVREFACPVSEGEMGSHVLLKTANGVVQVHLAPGRIMRSQKLAFATGDQLTVIGSQVRLSGNTDLIAREITRGNESFVFRDRTGKLMLVQ